MTQKITELLIKSGLGEAAASAWGGIITALAAVLFCALAYFIAKKPLLAVIGAAVKKSRGKWDDVLHARGVFDRLVLLVPALMLYYFAPVFGPAAAFVRGLAGSFAVLAALFTFARLLDAANDIYSSYELSKQRPIKGYLQVIKIISFIVSGVLVISALLDKSPAWILGGIGAATAVLILIFQNTILGFVASIQLTENDMLHIGDWIEVPERSANGFVTDISLHTVKVQNWDKSITTLPTHSLMTESFINWRGMWDAGARRIKRALNIDMRSVRPLDGEFTARLEKLPYVKEYLQSAGKEGLSPTNLGALRAYLTGMLKNHPQIRSDMMIKVRYLDPGEHGIPLEIYAFTDTTEFYRFEDIQSEIIEHILAVIPQFGLRVFQNITGSDIAGIGGALSSDTNPKGEKGIKSFYL